MQKKFSEMKFLHVRIIIIVTLNIVVFTTTITITTGSSKIHCYTTFLLITIVMGADNDSVVTDVKNKFQ